MFPQMRRVIGFTSIRRAVGGVAFAPSVAGNHAHQHRAFLSTNSNKFHWFSYNGTSDEHSSLAMARVLPGTMLFSVAATSVVEEVDAKEAVHPKFQPSDIVLYQYEACPFCNKVKGIHSSSLLTFQPFVICFLFIFSYMI